MLVPAKAAILPVPVVPIPIVPLEFVQLIVAPAGVELKLIAVVFALAQTVWLVIAVRLGIGFTVIVNVLGVPLQPLNVGVATKFPDIAVEPVLVAVNDEISPFPEAPIPIAVFEFVQAIVDVAGATA